MYSTLQKIIDYKKSELSQRKRRVAQRDLVLRCRDQESARPFLKLFHNDHINIIAEMKQASPSAGQLCDDYDPVGRALQYQEGGARALSILTDEHFFQGSLAHIALVKKKVGLPCLRKDFTLHEYHLYEARAHGADAVLLLANILEGQQLKDYQALAIDLGMTALLEVHSREELDRILPYQPTLIGVNNRDLKSFKTDVQISHDLIPFIPKSSYAISESGLTSRDELDALTQKGFRGFLIGETLMRERDPRQKLKQLCGL